MRICLILPILLLSFTAKSQNVQNNNPVIEQIAKPSDDKTFFQDKLTLLVYHVQSSKQIDSINLFLKRYGIEGFQIVLVQLDTHINGPISLSNTKGWKRTTASTIQDITQLYPSQSQDNLMIDEKGQIIATHLKASEIQLHLNEFLARKTYFTNPLEPN